jgi:hypothetical protein
MRGFLSTGQRWRLLGVAFAGHLALSGSFALAQQAADPKPESTPAGKSSALDALVYVPHDYGAPEVTETAGARGGGEAETELPNLLVLAPPKLARTLSTQPTLYWYLSGPSRVPVRLTLDDVEATSPAPLLELDLGALPAAGVYATALADHGVRLEPGHRYEWSVALAVNPEAYSEERVAKTILATAEADPALLARIAEGPALARIEALATAGYWYDALDLLAQQIAAGDRSQPWRELRATLLEQEQVGLQAVAAFERGAGALDGTDRRLGN